MIPSKPLPSATPSPRSDVDQKATDEAKAQDSLPRQDCTRRTCAKRSSRKGSQAGFGLGISGPRQQNQDPDLGIAWNSWHQVPEYELRIRTEIKIWVAKTGHIIWDLNSAPQGGQGLDDPTGGRNDRRFGTITRTTLRDC